jgi:hypothetical protein
MVSVRTRTLLLLLVAAAAAMAPGCSGVLKPEYEYEEELDLSLDGSATLNVNASVAALVALRGVDLDVDPRARIDRDRVRALFAGPGVTVTRVSLSRRNGRRFVHVGLEVEDVRRLSQVPRFAWSAYRFDRRGEVMEFRQAVGAAAGAAVGDVGWTGDEMVSFRLHLPSVVPFHNSPGGLERGNIVTWEQPLSERLQGTPLALQVNMEPESILYSTLLLFGSTIVAAAIVFAVVIWLVARRGRAAAAAESRL